MIRVERDPAFWAAICEHPAVAPTIKVKAEDWATIIGRADVLPLATDLGGHLFVALDGIGRSWELHSAFRPEVWGRGVNEALKASLGFLGPWDVVVCHEVSGWWRSRPPKSYGFRAAGEFHASPIGDLRTWILTRAAWERSPVRRRME